MTSFYKLLEKLNNEEEEEVRPKLPEKPESSHDLSTLDLGTTDQEMGVNEALRDKERSPVINDEHRDTAPLSTEAPSTRTLNFVNPVTSDEDIFGTGSPVIRLIDQFPGYGISDKGELILIEDTLDESLVNTFDEGAKVRTGSFMEGNFSLFKKDSIPENSRARSSLSTTPRFQSSSTVGGSVRCNDTNSIIPPKHAVTEPVRTVERAMPSALQPCALTKEQPKVSFTANQNQRVPPRIPALSQADVDHQPHETSPENILSLGCIPEQSQLVEAKAQPNLHHFNVAASAQSFPQDVPANFRAREGPSQTPATFASNSSVRSFLPSASLLYPMKAEVELQQFLKCLDSNIHSSHDGSSCEKPRSVQNGSIFQVGASDLQPNSLSDTTSLPNISPTSLLDEKDPFQSGDTNMDTDVHKNTELTTANQAVTLDPNQILANDRLIKHARNIIGKRPTSSPDHSFVTPEKRTRMEFKTPETTRLQPTPQNVNALFAESQMSPVTLSTQEMLSKRHAIFSPRPLSMSNVPMQNFQELGPMSAIAVPNVVSNVPNPGPMLSMNYHDTNVRSENVDIPKRYHCKACLAVFSFKENCERHYKVVHLKRQVFQCPHCPSSYLQPKTMRCHIDKKHCKRSDKISILPCYWCRSTFSTHQEWEIHAAQVHPEQRCKFRGKCP